jgi:hypothetical protein
MGSSPQQVQFVVLRVLFSLLQESMVTFISCLFLVFRKSQVLWIQQVCSNMVYPVVPSIIVLQLNRNVFTDPYRFSGTSE